MQEPKYYILDGDHKPVSSDLMEWARWLEDGGHRHVAITERDGVRVSTVFLGMNHNWGEGPPLLFETMIFGGQNTDWQERCSTWDEAEAMHEVACRLAFPTH